MVLGKELLGFSKRDLVRLVMQQQEKIAELEKRLAAYENVHMPPSLRKGWRKPAACDR